MNLDLELVHLGDSLERAARRDLSSRLGPTRRRRTFAVALSALALVAGVGAALAASLSGGSHIDHGKLVLPRRVAAEMGRLNAALDACYIANGARRVELGGNAFAYAQAGRAETVCQPQQDAVNAFADGPEMRAATHAAEPLLKAFWNCMLRSGALPQDTEEAAVDQSSPTLRAATDKCSAEANAAMAAH
jgi:hypothetical protein